MRFPERSGESNSPSNYLKIKDGESVTGILVGELYTYYQTGFGPTAKVVGPGQGKERHRANIAINGLFGFEIKIWEFGSKLCDDLASLSAAGWDMDKTFITISRSGTTKETTRWTVTPNKREPTTIEMNTLSGLELNKLDHHNSNALDNEPKPPVKNYAPSSDDGDTIPW